MPFMPVQIFIQAAKMEEEIFCLSKIIKNDSKIIKRRIERIKRIFSVHRRTQRKRKCQSAVGRLSTLLGK